MGAHGFSHAVHGYRSAGYVIVLHPLWFCVVVELVGVGVWSRVVMGEVGVVERCLVWEEVHSRELVPIGTIMGESDRGW